MTIATSSPTPPSPGDGGGDRRTIGRGSAGLAFALTPRPQAVELALRGDLDLANAPRLLAAMAWLRRRYRQVIVIDTRDLAFVDIAGYRALEASLDDAHGERDPRVVYVVGEVLARLQRLLATITGRAAPRLS